MVDIGVYACNNDTFVPNNRSDYCKSFEEITDFIADN